MNVKSMIAKRGGSDFEPCPEYTGRAGPLRTKWLERADRLIAEGKS